MKVFLLLPALLLTSISVPAQSNADSGIDVELASITSLTAMDRKGVFPGGVNGCAMTTTVCNLGTKQVNWQEAMDPDHPFISFVLARESAGRFEQISDRSYVKHGFFALSNSLCNTCSPTNGTVLGLGCSDTYSTTNNGDNYWLGPPDEIDAWLGLWDPFCSQFDRGEPAVAAPNDCNGVRNLSHTQANALLPVGHRIQVLDSDFGVAGATYWYQGMYVVEGEGDITRDDNIGSRQFTASWNGARWTLTSTGVMTHGSVLTRWTGASIASATNGGDDGRLYVAVKVTGPVDGFYHYEYAVHNRDNNRGVGALHIPVCAGARVTNVGFSDIDDKVANDWTSTVGSTDILFSTASNPLKWNTIFNFWFDSDAAPASTTLDLDEAAAGPGLASVGVTSSAPLALFNVFLGAGCANDTPPTLFATGTPAQATLGNASFALNSTGNTPFQPCVLRFSLVPGSFVFHGCTFYQGNSMANSRAIRTAISDASGLAVFAASIPNDLSLEGIDVDLQVVSREPGNGTFLQNSELSDALRVRVGDFVSSCP